MTKKGLAKGEVADFISTLVFMENKNMKLAEAIKKKIKKVILESLEENDFFGLEEAKQRNVVIRGGKRKRVTTSTIGGTKIVAGKVERQGAAERVARKRGAKKGARKRNAKLAVINRKRARSMAKRSSMGL